MKRHKSQILCVFTVVLVVLTQNKARADQNVSSINIISKVGGK